MTVGEFNLNHASDKLTLDPATELSIIRKQGDEWLIEVNQRQVWVGIKKEKEVIQRQPLIKHHSSLLPVEELVLGPQLFFVLYYLRHLTGDTIHQPKAASELGLSTKTLRTHLQELKKLGKIDYETSQMGTVFKYIDGKVRLM